MPLCTVISLTVAGSQLFGDSKLLGKAYTARMADTPTPPAGRAQRLGRMSGPDTKPSKAVSTCQQRSRFSWREPRRLRHVSSGTSNCKKAGPFRFPSFWQAQPSIKPTGSEDLLLATWPASAGERGTCKAPELKQANSLHRFGVIATLFTSSLYAASRVCAMPCQ